MIGKKQFLNDNTSIECYATKDCNAKKVDLDVHITNDPGLAAPVVTWHCLLPKLAADETVAVNIYLG